MSAQASEKVLHPLAKGTSMSPSRATLQTRPRIQRTWIRSWDYIPSARATILGIRLLVVVWLIVFLGR